MRSLRELIDDVDFRLRMARKDRTNAAKATRATGTDEAMAWLGAQPEGWFAPNYFTNAEALAFVGRLYRAGAKRVRVAEFGDDGSSATLMVTGDGSRLQDAMRAGNPDEFGKKRGARRLWWD